MCRWEKVFSQERAAASVHIIRRDCGARKDAGTDDDSTGSMILILRFNFDLPTVQTFHSDGTTHLTMQFNKA